MDEIVKKAAYLGCVFPHPQGPHGQEYATMILMRSNIPPNFNPVAIGAPQFGETRLQITQTPNTTVKQQKNLQKVNGSSCGGAMVNC